MQSELANSCYFGGDAVTCLLDQLVASVGGEALFGLVIGGVIFVIFYIGADGDMATPTVALILAGTVVIGMLPKAYQDLAYGIVVIGLAAAIWQVMKQYVLSGGAVR